LQNIIGHEIYGRDWPTIRVPKVLAKMGAWVQEKVSPDEAFVKPWMIDLADQAYPVSPQRAHELLGWEPRHRLRDTIPQMIRRLREDPVRWYEINGIPVPEEAMRR
jgi:nucleoside-diphosphate-sugar epimerase